MCGLTTGAARAACILLVMHRSPSFVVPGRGGHCRLGRARRSAGAVLLTSIFASRALFAQTPPPAPAPPVTSPPTAPAPEIQAYPPGPAAPAAPPAPPAPAAADVLGRGQPGVVPGVVPYGAPYAAAPYGAPSPWGEGTGGVYVELRTDNPNVRIDRVVEGTSVGTVCFAPCRKVLPRSNAYVITGDGVHPTSSFVLPDDRQQLTLDVHAGSSVNRTVGAAVLLVGGITAYLGLFAAEIYTLGAIDSSPSSSSSRRDASTGALLVTGLGIVGVVTGIFLISSSRTTVVSSTGNSFSDGAPARPARHRPAVAVTARGLEF
jgi:hypothetical protein